MDPQAINRMLEARVKDLAERRMPSSRSEHQESLAGQRDALAKALDLYPDLPRTDLKARVTGTLDREGYRIEKVRYQSRPGLLVTAHLYLPAGNGPFPVVVAAHGHWAEKKSAHWVQARGIGLALLGIACLTVDSPGHAQDDESELNERSWIGNHNDPFLAMGATPNGVYAWDLIRGLDYLASRPDIDLNRAGVTGDSGGGAAAIFAFALDQRFYSCAPMVSFSSWENNLRFDCGCNYVPGLLEVGDRPSILGMRAPNPVLIVAASDDSMYPVDGAIKGFEKLRKLYSHYNARDEVRLEIVEGPHTLSRRMREATYAFFAETLLTQPRRGHIPEPRPLTDSHINSYVANTEDPASPELLVTSPEERESTTFHDLLAQSYAEPHPSAYDAAGRLVGWGRYGKIEHNETTLELNLKDGENVRPEEVEQRLATLLGLSVPEVYAQLLHLQLPGRPEGWESHALGGDAISSLIASVKTLVSSSAPEEPLKRVVADGPASSMTAIFLAALRPGLEIQVTHAYESWRDIVNAGHPSIVQPGARYLSWPKPAEAPQP